MSKCGVLVSGGLDSAVLLAELAAHHSTVYPLFIEAGFPWEGAERRYLKCFLDVVRAPAIQPLSVLAMPVADLYRDHWSMTGQNVPDAASTDEAVFLPGRNVLLLAKAMIWCHLHEVPVVALGLLASNPFPDAMPSFFAAYAAAVNQAVRGAVQVLRPFAALKKVDVLRRGRELPLELTFSCLQPLKTSEVSGSAAILAADSAGKMPALPGTSQVCIHCGRCNKCGERRRAFREAGIPDPTNYASERLCIA